MTPVCYCGLNNISHDNQGFEDLGYVHEGSKYHLTYKSFFNSLQKLAKTQSDEITELKVST